MQSFDRMKNRFDRKNIRIWERTDCAFQRKEIDEEENSEVPIARGVSMGQRQPGVQMIRIKLPYDEWPLAQLPTDFKSFEEIPRSSYTWPHVRIFRSLRWVWTDAALWAELAAGWCHPSRSLRETRVTKCNCFKVGRIDQSGTLLIVTPMQMRLFQYFLRKSCFARKMGEKVSKMAFSSSDEDNALGYLHDLGFIRSLKKSMVNSARFKGPPWWRLGR